MLLVALALLIPALTNSAYHLSRSAQALSSLAASTYEQQVNSIGHHVEHVLLEEQADILFLSQSPAIRRYVNNASASALNNVTDYMTIFLSRHVQEYVGACILDDSGQEKVCLHTSDQHVSLLDTKLLKDRFREVYFTETLSFISIPGAGVPVFTDNVKSDDHSPNDTRQIIRFSTLLQSDSGKISGVLVLEASFDYLLSFIRCETACGTYDLLDNDGRFLYSESPSPYESFYDLESEAASVVLGQTQGSLQGTSASPQTLYAFARIHPSGQGSIQWTLVYRQLFDVVLSDLYSTRTVIFLLTLISLFIALMIAVWMIRRITRPLNQLIQASYQVAHGNFDVSLPQTKQRDEVGSLTLAFDMMLERLNDSISDLQASKDEIAAREKKFRAVFDRAGDAILLIDDDMRYVDINTAACRMFGVERERFLQMTIADLLMPDVSKDYIQAQWHAMLEMSHQVGELVYTRSDGEKIVAEYQTDARILPGLHLSILRDITLRKQTEEALSLSLSTLQSLFDTDAAFMVVLEQVDDDFRIVHLNQATARVFGLTTAQIVGRKSRDVGFEIDDTTRRFWFNALKALTSQQEAMILEETIELPVGKIWFYGSLRRIQSPNGAPYFSIVAVDITERRRMEEELRLMNSQLEERIAASTAELRVQHAQLKLLTDNASDLICLHAPDGTYQYASPSSMLLLGYAPETLVGTKAQDYIHPDDNRWLTEKYRLALEKKPEYEEAVYRIRRQDGSYISLESITRPIFNPQGEITYLLNISRDVTKRLALEQELREAEQFVNAVMDSLSAHIAVINQEGTILAVNQSWRTFGRIHGGNETTIRGVGLNYLDICADAESEPSAFEVSEGIRRVLDQTLKEFYYDYSFESNNHTLWFSMRVSYFEDKGLPHAVIAHTDISERKIHELQIQLALEKEQQINTLRTRFLAMISHDFRTPLASIQVSTDLLTRYASRFSEAERRQRLGRIQHNVQYLNGLIDDVVYIGRAQLGEVRFAPQETDLRLFCQEIVADVNLAFGAEERIEMHLDGAARPVRIDHALMHKILMNLLSNALKYSQKMVKLCLQFEAQQLTIRVVDQGIGIPLEEQKALFETFYRASNVGGIAGTGLGLAIVHQAVHLHGGTITFESIEGQGTTFIITLPDI